LGTDDKYNQNTKTFYILVDLHLVTARLDCAALPFDLPILPPVAVASRLAQSQLDQQLRRLS